VSDIKRLGVFGGTFDPVHNAHLNIARTALAQAGLDKVLFVVSARPPHKQEETPSASPEQRLAMVCAALADEPRMEGSRIELDRSGASYTAETLETLAEQYPDAAMYLIIGHDSMIDLPRWRRPERILELAHLLVVPRPGMHRDVPPELDGHYTMLDFPETPVSSTQIRESFLNGPSVSHLLPRPVEDMIRREGIYPCR
jgi:nicotinate-nucleotide adenylyltransferase